MLKQAYEFGLLLCIDYTEVPRVNYVSFAELLMGVSFYPGILFFLMNCCHRIQNKSKGRSEQQTNSGEKNANRMSV